MKLILISLFLLLTLDGFTKEKIVYKYKKYEKFDFDALTVEGQKGFMGDLSLIQRNQRKFKYHLPLRKNFHYEMRKAIARVR